MQRFSGLQKCNNQELHLHGGSTSQRTHNRWVSQCLSSTHFSEPKLTARSGIDVNAKRAVTEHSGVCFPAGPNRNNVARSAAPAIVCMSMLARMLPRLCRHTALTSPTSRSVVPAPDSSSESCRTSILPVFCGGSGGRHSRQWCFITAFWNATCVAFLLRSAHTITRYHTVCKCSIARQNPK